MNLPDALPSKAEFEARMQKVFRGMSEQGVDSMIIGPSADLRYLTGLEASPRDRLTALVIDAPGSATLVLPEIERDAAALVIDHTGVKEVRTWGDSRGVLSAISGLLAKSSRLAVNPDLTARELLRIQSVIRPKEVVTSEAIVGVARIYKSEWEVQQLTQAAHAIARVHDRVPEVLRVGRSEEEIALDLADLMIEAGHIRADFVIVAAGANAAEPHHEPGAKQVEPGELIVIDIGGPLASGYFSDMTRMYACGLPSKQLMDSFDAVKKAQELALAAVASGGTTSEVDSVARDYLDQMNLGEYFIHRLGHGIGLEVHEKPVLGGEEETLIEDSMAFSIEPGVYVPGQFGVRTEDIVVVKNGAAQRINDTKHDLVIL